MNTHPRFVVLYPLLTLIAFAFTNCKKDSLAPFQPEVGSLADNFQMQATGVTNVSTTVQYAWQNSGIRALVNHSTATTGGSSMLTLKDAAGTVVYNKPLVASLNDSTSAGVAGGWTVQLVLTNFSGTINFRAQKI